MSKQFHKTGSSVSERDTKEKKGARTCLLEKQKKRRKNGPFHYVCKLLFLCVRSFMLLFPLMMWNPLKSSALHSIGKAKAWNDVIKEGQSRRRVVVHDWQPPFTTYVIADVDFCKIFPHYLQEEWEKNFWSAFHLWQIWHWFDFP